MKPFLLNLLLISTGIFSSCNTSENSANSFEPNSRVKILEISSDFAGFFWMNGEVLDFRLFENGEAEYDEYPFRQNSSGILKVDDVKQIKQIKINETDLKEIISILMSEEFLSNPENFSPQKICKDSFINTNIDFNFEKYIKKIKIGHHCSALSQVESTSSQFKNFPLKINELFKKIETIKNRESSGKFYN